MSKNLTPEEVEDIQQKLSNAFWFVNHLSIINDHGQWASLDPLWEEQVEAINAFIEYRKIYVLKCRQIGMTTIMTALLFWKLYTSPNPLRLLTIAHEHAAAKRTVAMMKQFWRGLPSFLRAPLKKDNAFEVQWAHNEGAINSLMAGGRGQAKSYTFTDLLATEQAYWPMGSAAGGKDQDTSADADMWQSALATIHAPDAHVIVESTANGPRGLFYDLSKTAQLSDEWAFLFFPWTGQARYSKEFATPDAKVQFTAELRPEEQVMLDELDLTLEQIHWRRSKFEDEGYTLVRFRREFPLTSLEPFLLDDGGWFDQDVLSAAIALIPPGRENVSTTLRIYAPYEAGRRYFLGVDTSGGVGQDYFAIQVLRDDMVHCATFVSNRINPDEQHYWVSKVGGLYGGNYGNKPLTIVERNKYGKTVIENLETMGACGVVLWKNEKSKDFYSSGASSDNTKGSAYSYARTVIDHGWVLFGCPHTVRQLQVIVEKANGKIEAATGHDDLADAMVLALWAGRQHFDRAARVPTEKDRYRALRAAARDPFRNRRTDGSQARLRRRRHHPADAWPRLPDQPAPAHAAHVSGGVQGQLLGGAELVVAWATVAWRRRRRPHPGENPGQHDPAIRQRLPWQSVLPEDPVDGHAAELAA